MKLKAELLLLEEELKSRDELEEDELLRPEVPVLLELDDPDDPPLLLLLLLVLFDEPVEEDERDEPVDELEEREAPVELELELLLLLDNVTLGFLTLMKILLGLK